jgi:hypothetical protein
VTSSKVLAPPIVEQPNIFQNPKKPMVFDSIVYNLYMTIAQSSIESTGPIGSTGHDPIKMIEASSTITNLAVPTFTFKGKTNPKVLALTSNDPKILNFLTDSKVPMIRVRDRGLESV